MRVIINCAPGCDDAIVLILAMGLENMDVLAVCTTAGKQTLDKTTLNARKVLSFRGRRVLVARGAVDFLQR